MGKRVKQVLHTKAKAKAKAKAKRGFLRGKSKGIEIQAEKKIPKKSCISTFSLWHNALCAAAALRC